MSEFEKDKWSPSTESLARLRNLAITNFAIGASLAALQVLGRVPAVGFIAGGVLCAVGIGWLLANNPANKRTGAMITALGVLVLASRIRILQLLVIVTTTVLNIATIGFLVLGVKYLISYFIAQSRRN